MAEPLLQVRNLRTEFHTRRATINAVNDVSFDIGEGELVGLIGETGSGKSVTARSIMRLVQPPGRIVAGQVEFDGTDLLRVSEKQMRSVRGAGIALIPQNPWGALNPIRDIGTQFRSVLQAHQPGLSKAECHELASTSLDAVGIPDPDRVLRGFVHQLSGGMAQRVVIGIALAANPRLTVADEPTTGLDVTIQRQVLDLIAELLAGGRRSMLLVTHDLGVVAQYCQRVMVMYAGRLVETGPVHDVFHHATHPYTQALLGSVPRPGHALTRLRGTVPNLATELTGCAFADRCDHRLDICSVERPPQRRHGEQVSACHLDLEGVGHGAR